MSKRRTTRPRISKTTLKDPSNTLRLSRAFEKDLVKLLKNARHKLPLLFEGIRMNQRSLEVTRIDSIDSANRIGLILQYEFEIPGIRITNEYIRKAYTTGAIRADDWLKSVGVSAGVGWTIPTDPKSLEALQTRGMALVKGLSDDVKNKMTQELTAGMLRGEGIDKLSKRLNNIVDNIGITRAETIARTETMTAANTALLDRYAKLGIEQVEWLTAWDERVCPVCEPYNEKVFDRGSQPECPAHPNCRCTLLPVIPEVNT